MKPTHEKIEDLDRRVAWNYNIALTAFVFAAGAWSCFITGLTVDIINATPEEHVELKITKTHDFDGNTFSFMIGQTEDGRLFRKQSTPIGDEGDIIKVRLSNGWNEQ